jgi:hypothetical protein
VLAATKDVSLSLGVGYDCPQIQPAEKERQKIVTPARSAYAADFGIKKTLISQRLSKFPLCS